MPTITLSASDGEREMTGTFNTSIYRTPDAAILRARADYFINLLFSHRRILDALVERGAKKVADGIAAEERHHA